MASHAASSHHKGLHRRSESARMLAPSMGAPASRPPGLAILPDDLLASRPPSPLAALADVLRPRKSRLRTTVLALFALVLLSAYILLAAQPSLVSSPPPLFHQAPNSNPNDSPSRQQQQQPDSWAQLLAKYRPGPHAPPRPSLALDPNQELAALTGFMAALPQNVLPNTVDPSAPLDPALVLDFDPASDVAHTELEGLVRDVWARNPVVVFAKTRSAASREMKAILDDLHLRPAPITFEVNERDDADVLIPLLHRITGVPSLPILLIGGVPLGELADVRKMRDEGTLRAVVERAGAVPDGAKKKKKGRAH